MKKTQKQTVFRTEWFEIEEERFDQVSSLNGKPYYRINSSNGVIILALTVSGEIVLIKQFRPAFNQYTLEFPSGAINENEMPREAATRELFEETGYECQDLLPLGTGRIMMNRYSGEEYAFLGVGAKKNAGYENKEDIDVLLLKPSQFRSLILSGEFEQLAAMALYLMADLKFGIENFISENHCE